MDPVAYILKASDLRPIHQHNMIFEYADDTYLIVPNMFSSLYHWNCNIT